MSPSQQPKSTNPANLKNQFAHRFVRALNNLNHTKPSPHDHNHIYKRSNHVKVAAYTAMASVVGSRRAWSRSVLLKIRNGSRNRKRVHHKLITNCHHHAKVCLKKRNLYNPKRSEGFNPFTNPRQELKLRKLVPGSETMDSWCLMGETADYIKCLAAQVEVMKTLVDIYANT